MTKKRTEAFSPADRERLREKINEQMKAWQEEHKETIEYWAKFEEGVGKKIKALDDANKCICGGDIEDVIKDMEIYRKMCRGLRARRCTSCKVEYLPDETLKELGLPFPDL